MVNNQHRDSDSLKRRKMNNPTIGDDPFATSTRGGTLTEQAFRVLEEMIVTLRLAPGTMVSEVALSAAVGIGRTPVREALQRLAGAHLIKVLPRNGILISPIDVGQQMRLIEARTGLEVLVARASAVRATDAERKQMRDIVARIYECADKNDVLGFLRVDAEYKAILLDSARNEFLKSALAPMHSLARRFWYLHNREARDLEIKTRLHIVVMEAVIEGNVGNAQSLAAELMAYIEAFTIKTLDRGLAYSSQDPVILGDRTITA
jgi:DNA-binding GntR family transcriptional regulator